MSPTSSAGYSEFPANSQIYRQQGFTVSRRSEPSSRTALMGEQPNPWDLLQPQDATSRHRTFIRRYRRRRLSLHPALSSEGSAYCGDRRFRKSERSPPRPVGLSRYGVKLRKSRLPTRLPTTHVARASPL